MTPSPPGITSPIYPTNNPRRINNQGMNLSIILFIMIIILHNYSNTEDGAPSTWTE